MSEYDELVKRLESYEEWSGEDGGPSWHPSICDEAVAAIKALQERGQWQDISTAPNDKTKVLVARKNEGPIIAKQTGMGTWINCFPTRSADRVLDGERTPTHWQPLPPPPTT